MILQLFLLRWRMHAAVKIRCTSCVFLSFVFCQHKFIDKNGSIIVAIVYRTVNMSDTETNNEPTEFADEQLLMSSAETESISSSSNSGIGHKKITQTFLNTCIFCQQTITMKPEIAELRARLIPIYPQLTGQVTSISKGIKNKVFCICSIWENSITLVGIPCSMMEKSLRCWQYTPTLWFFLVLLCRLLCIVSSKMPSCKSLSRRKTYLLQFVPKSKYLTIWQKLYLDFQTFFNAVLLLIHFMVESPYKTILFQIIELLLQY